MKKYNYVLAFVVLACSLGQSYATPFPLGLELGKAKLAEIKQKYKVEDLVNLCGGISECYYISNLKKSGIKGASSAILTLDREKILHDITIYVDKKQYNDLLKSFSNKYFFVRSIKEEEREFCHFSDGDFTIIVESPNKDKSFTIRYVSKIGDQLDRKCRQKHGIL